MRTVLCIGVLLTGCFYIDPINQKPELFPVTCKIEGNGEGENSGAGTARSCLQGGSVRRGDLLVLEADFRDKDNSKDTASFDWKAFECSDSEATVCSETPFQVAREPAFAIEIPQTLRDVRAILAEMELRDELGASAEQSARFVINDPPKLLVRPEAHAFVVGGPVQLYATVSDVDEGPDGLQVTWDVIAPAPSAVPLVELPNQGPTNPSERTYGKLLVPDRPGEWDVRIRATDTVPDQPETDEKHVLFSVAPDQPPCLAQSVPLVPPDGASLPVAEPTLFQVAVVVDDLDPYPPPNETQFGTTEFEWSILPPGSPGRQLLTGATGNSVDFDPSVFTPGEIVELRVEIFDRKTTNMAIPCVDSAASCAISEPTCIQRQTWRVEVR